MDCSATFFGLLQEFLFEVLKESSIEVGSTQVSVTSSSLDSEHTALDVEERHIEGTSTKIVDEDVALLVGLAGTETVGNSGSGGLVDDTENVKTSDGTGILGSLTLVVVEVSWDSDDGLLDLLAELSLSNLLHLQIVRAELYVAVDFGSPPTLTRTMAEIS